MLPNDPYPLFDFSLWYSFSQLFSYTHHPKSHTIRSLAKYINHPTSTFKHVIHLPPNIHPPHHPPPRQHKGIRPDPLHAAHGNVPAPAAGGLCPGAQTGDREEDGGVFADAAAECAECGYCVSFSPLFLFSSSVSGGRVGRCEWVAGGCLCWVISLFLGYRY